MELVDLVRGAQDAMDRGDYHLATTASAHGLAAYPSCLAAHRILGEAHLELGNTAPATKHFEHTLAVDPLNVVARLGLGVASEEQKDYGAAYAHYLHAWEINPALDQVRDELVRLRGLLGVEDRLHPTRAGLAGIHARGGQLHRAANEWRAVLAVEPESRRARTSFAELLWRQGEDGLASVACRDALRGCPENARALAILADIERRRGGPGADEFAQRYRAVDPTGDVLRLLSEWRADADLGFLATQAAPVDDFDFSAHAAPVDQRGGPPKVVNNAMAGNQIAAPDLWDTLVKDLSSELPATGVAPTLASGVEPFTWNDAGPGGDDVDQFADLGIQPFNVDDLGGDSSSSLNSFVEPASHDTEFSTADIYTAALSREPSPTYQMDQSAPPSSIDGQDELAALFAPSTDQEIAAATPGASADDAAGGAALWGGAADGASAHAGGMDGFDDLATLGIEPFSFDATSDAHADVYAPFPHAPQPASRPAQVMPELSVADRTVHAPAERIQAMSAAAPAVEPPVFVDPFVGADGKIDLTSGWDDLDRSLAAATPSFAEVGHYDDLAAELDLDGIVPFDADIPGQDEDAWAPLTDDDLGITSAPVARAGQAPAPVVETASPSMVSGSDWPLMEEPTLPVADWPLPDDVTAFEEPTALDALMSLPAIDAPFDQTLSSADTARTLDMVPQADRDEDEGLIGSELMAIPVTFDDEVIFGIPAQQASGYTELLRHVDVEELDGGGSELLELDPFENPDANGDPLAFDDLLAVTSRDGTSPLVDRDAVVVEAVVPVDVLGTSALDAIPATGDAQSAVDGMDLDLGAFDPFDFADLVPVLPSASLESPPEAEVADVTGPAGGIYTGIFESQAAADAQLNEMLDPFALDSGGSFGSGVGMGSAHASSPESEMPPFDFESALAEFVPSVPVIEAPEPLAATDVPPARPAEEAPEWTGSGGLGMAIGSVVWPSFVNQTSDLIDRDRGNGSVFARLRASKAALVESGQVTVDRRLTVPARAVEDAPALVEVGEDPTPSPSEPSEPVLERRRQVPEMSEQTRLDLMAMRVRLIEHSDAAEEVAATVEKAVSQGLCDPLALRILGEAYLRLGKMEQAAAQFRQALLARQRSR